MNKLIIKSYQARGYIAEFKGEDLIKLKKYCKENSEDIEFLFAGPEEEDLIREILQDEEYDLYDNNLDSTEKYGFNETALILDNNFEMFFSKNGEISKVDLENIVENKDFIKIKNWKEENKNQEVINYAFGYISDDIVELEIDLEDIEIDEFDPKKLSLNVCDNEFFEEVGLYVNEIEYDQEWIDSSSEDLEGSYFNTNFHQS